MIDFEGHFFETPGNTRIFLEKRGVFWFLEKGSVNVFVIEKKEDETVGPRRLLGTLSAPCCLFAINTYLPDYQIVAITEGEAQFREIDASFLSKHEKELLPYLKKWTEAFSKKEISSFDDLETFHEELLQDFFSKKKALEEIEFSRFNKKKEDEEELLNKTLLEMGKLINPQENFNIVSQGEPLFQACQIVGQFLKVKFIAPVEPLKDDYASQHIAEFCALSGLFFRQVNLTGEWWKSDCGPIVAFYGEEKQPVALINKSPKKYMIINPETKEKKRVDKVEAKKLFRAAFVFYRPFPETLKSAQEVTTLFLKNHRKEFIPLAIYGVIASILALFPSIATGFLFNTILPNVDRSLLLQLGLGLFVAAISTSLFSFFSTLVLLRIQGISTNEIQSAFWDRLLKLPYSFFRKFSTGNLILRVTAIDQIRTLLTDRASKAIISGMFSLFFLLAMAIFSLRLTLVAICLIGINVLLTYVCGRINIDLEKKILEMQGKINGAVIQIISGVGKLRIAGAENNAFSYWAKLFTKFKKYDLRSKYVQAVVSVTNVLYPSLSLFFLFYLVMAMPHHLPLGTFLAFYAAFVPFSMAIYEFCNTFMVLTPVPALWERSKIILEEDQELLVQKNRPGPLQGGIHLDDIVFSYEKEGPIILNQLNIEVKPKEFVTIVGPSGCGKSTIVRLLLGFEKPQSGAIYFDEKDLQSLNIRDVRKQIGVVLQEGGIVFGSIYDNVACGGLYSQEQVEKALELSGFQQDLESFPMGLHTVLSMGGETLSGGQRQRLLIARALISNPKILILDEATTALDNVTEDKISSNIEKLDVTRIVIAHRLSTIKNADRIYVMDKGSVIQTGTFTELAHTPGLFRSMLERQKL